MSMQRARFPHPQPFSSLARGRSGAVGGRLQQLTDKEESEVERLEQEH